MKFALSILIVALFGAAGLIFIGSKNVCQNHGNREIASRSGREPARAEISIPKFADWVDYGSILEAGAEGDWDFNLNWLASVVKKNRTYHLYYVGSDGYRSDDGEGARHRAIGLATSPDGIHFRKYRSNPVMTHRPFNGEEEGANSAGITLGTDGDFVMYYGAAVGPKDQINADGRVAISKDGFTFTDIARVLDHRSPLVHRFVPNRFHGAHPFIRRVFHPAALHGHGDEIFPVASFQNNENWHVYYMPNGGTAPRTLGLAWGQKLDRLPCSVQVLDGNWSRPVRAWGNVIRLAPDKIALFVQKLWWPDTFVEVHTASLEAPHQLSQPVARYEIPELRFGTVFLDVERRTWFMYYATFTSGRFLRVKLAPAGERDITPPSMPKNVAGVAVTYDKVELSWETAEDPDTGVVQYNVYRDGMAIGTTKSSKFMDSGLVELNRYVYAVAAVNFHGVEGPAAQKLITTPADTSAPRVVTAQSSTNPTQLSVVFSEPVDPASASEVANYSIDRGISVEKVSFDTERGIATLATSPQEENATYTLTVKRILDRASSPNRINPNNKTLYTYSHIAGLVGYWRFDGEREPLVRDRSGLHNDGHGHRVSWHDNALAFNGKDSYVMIPNSFSLRDVTNKSFTFVATVKPDGFPQSANGYGIFLRTGSHPAYFFGLSYRSDKTFDAQLITNRGDSPIRASSKAVDPGKWYHLTMVVDDATKIMTLYVNGEPVSPTRFTGTLRDLNEEAGGNYIAGEYYIGSTKPDRGTGSFFARHFRGEISEVRLYDRALDSTAVQTLFAKNGALRNTKSITN